MTATGSKSSAPLWGHLAALVAMIVWAGSYSVVKVALAEIPPLTFVAVRCTAGGVLMLLLARGLGVPIRLLRHDVPRIALLGCIGIGAGQGLWAMGLERTSASNTSILLSLGPIFMLLYLNLLGRQRASALQWTGVLVAMAGTVVLVAGQGHSLSLSQRTLQGDLLMLAVPMISAAYNLGLVRILARYDPRVVAGYVFFFGALVVWPLAFRATVALDWAAISWRAWLGFAYGLLLSLMVGYLLWYRALRSIGAVSTVTYQYLQPILGVLFASVYIGEKITLPLVVGSLIVLSGIVLTQIAVSGKLQPEET